MRRRWWRDRSGEPRHHLFHRASHRPEGAPMQLSITRKNPDANPDAAAFVVDTVEVQADAPSMGRQPKLVVDAADTHEDGKGAYTYEVPWSDVVEISVRP